MQFKKCAVVGVLIILCLSTNSWCLYIPENKPSLAPKKRASSPPAKTVQICGSELTDFILEVCNGTVNPYTQENSTNKSDRTEIVQDCCSKPCGVDYIESYCPDNPFFSLKDTFRGRLPNSLTRNRSFGLGASERVPYNGRNKEMTEVRVRGKKNGKRKWGKSKKRKRSFKRKCAYKSFGHYLLKLERGDRVRYNTVKGQNTIKKKWPSIQIGTISPEMDKFGGQPIVVVKKNKSNSI